MGIFWYKSFVPISRTSFGTLLVFLFSRIFLSSVMSILSYQGTHAVASPFFNFKWYLCIVSISGPKTTVILPVFHVKCFFCTINPNHHGLLKLLNYHSLDGKSWFKKQGSFWDLGRDYKVVSPVLPSVL